MAGMELGPEGSSVKCWKNGEVVPVGPDNGTGLYWVNLSLSDGNISGKDIYISAEYNGYSQDDNNYSKYWMNTTRISPTGSDVCYTSKIVVSDNDVYAVGTEVATTVPNTNTRIATYWKNGMKVRLTDGKRYASAVSIAISGTDVYVAGSENNAEGRSVAKYWKNGVATQLTDDASGGYSIDMVISNGDVYVLGIEEGIYKYWKNGIPTSISDMHFAAKGIAVSGGDVYVCGIRVISSLYDSYAAAYWKNGVLVTLPGRQPSFAFDIAVSGSDVYVAGYSSNDANYPCVAKYWRNDKEFLLPNEGYSAQATSIALDF